MKGIRTSPGDGLCWCHARFGLRAEAANDGICGKCAGRSASSCLRVHTGERLRALDAAEAESGEIALMLARIAELEGGEASGEPLLWVCYCGEVASLGEGFPHRDCDGGRPLEAGEIAARGEA